MRTLPNTIVIAPCDHIEAKKATIAISELNKPSYLRLQRSITKTITTNDTPFEIGKANVLYNPDESEVALISYGNLVSKTLEVAYDLEKEKINCTVINNHTIKPLDRETLIYYAKTCKAFVIIEDHQKAGGLGSAISELVSEIYPIPIEFIAVNDLFGETGTTEDLYKKHHLDNQSIKNAIYKVLKRKNNNININK
jgi:transketolase